MTHLSKAQLHRLLENFSFKAEVIAQLIKLLPCKHEGLFSVFFLKVDSV